MCVCGGGGVCVCVRAHSPNKPCVDDEAGGLMSGRIVGALLQGTNPHPVSPFSEHPEGRTSTLSSSYH